MVLTGWLWTESVTLFFFSSLCPDVIGDVRGGVNGAYHSLTPPWFHKCPFLLVAALPFVRGVFEVWTSHQWDRDLSKLTSIFRIG